MKTITVVAAIVKKGQYILCTQRNVNKHSYLSEKFEFPGGKVEPGETEEAALVREIQEELGLQISVDSSYLTVDHTYPDFRIIMHSYLCSALSDELVLHEHLSFQWLEPKDFLSLDWAEADVPIVELLMREASIEA